MRQVRRAATGPAQPAEHQSVVLSGWETPCRSVTRPAAYDHKPSTTANQARRRTQPCAGDARPLRVILPGEPPRLTPAAARALLRILLKAHARKGPEMTDQPTLGTEGKETDR